MTSGATPSVDEYEKYYADKEKGVAFIRVQNLTETGELQLEDLKYINTYTHQKVLKRSQVGPDDLLVKITGVGRMAVASVPPVGFEGNINQHIVAVKTENRLTSEYIAAFLNSDLGEKLASRRATGGTRPALDYPALASIPILADERIYRIAQQAAQRMKERESHAKELLAGIDSYMLEKLGIRMPELPVNNIQNRTFTINRSQVMAGRMDAYYHQPYYTEIGKRISQGKYPAGYLKQAVKGRLIKGYLPKQEEKGGENMVIQINSIQMDGSIDLSDLITASEVFYSYQKLATDDILVVVTGATIGKIGYWKYYGDYFLGGDIIKFQVSENFHPFFVYAWLRCLPSQIELKRNVTGATNGHLAPEDINHLMIPRPGMDIQEEIALAVQERMRKAAEWIETGREEYRNAKEEIDRIILE